MKLKHEITYISERDLLDAGCLDAEFCIEEATKALCEHHKGNVIFPEKTVQIFDVKSQSRLNTLPATLTYKGISGLKNVAVFPRNPEKFGIPNVSALIILHSLQNGLPFAVLDGKMISGMRTGATTSIAAKYLAINIPKVVGIIGSGEQAKYQLFNLARVYPSINHVIVYSLPENSILKFVETMTYWFPQMDFVPAKNGRDAVTDADIIITATSSQGAFLKAAWIKDGSFYSHIGGYEDEYEVAKKADIIVTDSWQMTKHRTQTLSRMFKEGVLQDKDIYADLDEIVFKNKVVRLDDSQFIYFNTVGLSYIDVAIASALYDRCVAKGYGSKLPLSLASPFDK